MFNVNDFQDMNIIISIFNFTFPFELTRVSMISFGHDLFVVLIHRHGGMIVKTLRH